MSLHYFNVSIAAKYGVNEAIVLQSIGYWLEKNIKDKRNFHDGRAWTYNSVKDMLQYFPYFTQKILYSTLRSLVKQELIIKGNYNKFGYDRTTWYSLSDEGETLLGIDVHTIPESVRREEEAINSLAEEMFGDEEHHTVCKKKENGYSDQGKSKSQNRKLDDTVKETGDVQKGGPIPVIETVTNTDKETNIEDKDGLVMPLKPGYVLLTLEEFASKCPLFCESCLIQTGRELFGDGFILKDTTPKNRKAIEERLSEKLQSGKLQIPLFLIEEEKKYKDKPVSPKLDE